MPEPQDLAPEFILSEVRKLQYLYRLKREIRYGQTREAHDLTESVAEHMYGMYLLAEYFLPLEDKTGTWDRLKIFEMITIHDLDEVETGDTIGYLKTETMRQEQRGAMGVVLHNTPEHLQSHFKSLCEEYESQITIEAKFVKAIDRFEPLIQLYSDFGKKIIALKKTTPEQTNSIKVPFIRPFPVMFSFNQVVHNAMMAEGFFNHGHV